MNALVACGMRWRSGSGWKQAGAALVLLVWLGALFLCSAECLWARCHSHSEDPHEHDANSHSAATHSHDSGNADHRAPPNGPNETGFCGSLDTMLLTLGQNMSLKPDVPLAWVLCSSMVSMQLSIELAEILSMRHAKKHISVFKHEVRTFPAHRSNAPPIHLLN